MEIYKKAIFKAICARILSKTIVLLFMALIKYFVWTLIRHTYHIDWRGKTLETWKLFSWKRIEEELRKGKFFWCLDDASSSIPINFFWGWKGDKENFNTLDQKFIKLRSGISFSTKVRQLLLFCIIVSHDDIHCT